MTILLILLSPLVPALLALAVPRADIVARVGAVLLAVLTVVSIVAESRSVAIQWTWIEQLGLAFDLALDSFAVVMVALIMGIGALVLWYSSSYFPDHIAYRRFVTYFLFFASAMSGLVMSSDLFTMFVFWEITSVLSFLLIGMNDESAAARNSALRALLVTGAGGLCLLLGVILFQVSTGTSNFLSLAQTETSGSMFEIAALLALIGALTKSAQFPFSFWLPGAMSAPTPVSAYLHSATMVKAGVVLILKLSPAVSHLASWRWAVVVLGGITMLQGGFKALAQVDAKLLLAYSTVSQLGLLTMLAGFGNSTAMYAAVAHLVAHAIFKAGLFMSVGVVDHATGTRDIRELSGLRRSLPFVTWSTAVLLASMAGMIPFLGFVTKEKALATLLDDVGSADPETLVVLGFVVVGSVLSVAYSARLFTGMFGHKRDIANTPIDHAPDAGLVGPLLPLVGLTIGAAVVAGWWGTLMKAAARAIDAQATGKLILWPGVNTALVSSAAILLVGGLIGFKMSVHTRITLTSISGEHIFHRIYDGLLKSAITITRVTQSGSLVSYNAVVFAVVALAVGIPAFSMVRSVDSDLVLADSPAQAVLVLIAITFTAATVLAQARFTAALLAGGLGLTSAAIFALFGAPDLALTQLLVETLVIVVLLLVLRKMPTRFDIEPGWFSHSVRVIISVAVGVSVAVFALVTSTSRTAPSVGDEYLARSAPEGAGNNVVNVILVDFRGVDTLGEITVLIVAGLGIVNLYKYARTRRHDNDDTGHTTTDTTTEVPA